MFYLNYKIIGCTIIIIIFDCVYFDLHSSLIIKMLNIYYILALASFCASLKVCGDGKCVCDVETIYCTSVNRFRHSLMVSTKKIVLKDSWVRRVGWGDFPNLESIELINNPVLCFEDVRGYKITGDYALCCKYFYIDFLIVISFFFIIVKLFFQFQQLTLLLQNRSVKQ